MYSATFTRPKKNTFGILDVGSTKTLCLICKIDQAKGIPHVLSSGYKLTEGMRNGKIADIKKVSQSIINCVQSAEEEAGETIDQAYLNISGCNLISYNVSADLTLANNEIKITEKDTRRIIEHGYSKSSYDEVVLHNTPTNYSVDSTSGITNPVGMCGGRLHVDLHVLTSPRSVILNINHCIAECRLSLGGYVASPFALGFSCLTEDEKDLGVTVVDLGGGHSSLGVYKGGQIIYTDSIPIGGLHITRDIAYALSITVAAAEKLKTLYGSVLLLPTDEVVEVEQEGEKIEVTKAVLQNIIRPRIEEVLEMVASKIAYRNTWNRKVVLTGGGSRLSGVRELASEIINQQVRLSGAIATYGLADELASNPSFAASLGILNLIAYAEHIYKLTPKVGAFSRFISWLGGRV